MLQIGIHNNTRITPEPGLRAVCQSCGGELVSVCGEIYQHHWRHLVTPDYCNYKPKTEWHLRWQNLFPEKYREIKKGNHIADILLPDDTAIEFQHSSISPEDFRSRSENYKTIIWVLDVSKQYDNGQITQYESNDFCYLEYRNPVFMIKEAKHLYLDIYGWNTNPKFKNSTDSMGLELALTRRSYFQKYKNYNRPHIDIEVEFYTADEFVEGLCARFEEKEKPLVIQQLKMF
jgi:hypothetical protein